MRWLLWCFCLLVESYETINHWPLTIDLTLPKRWFGNMKMTSNCDVTNNAHRMTTIWPWTKPPMKIFCVRHWPVHASTPHPLLAHHHLCYIDVYCVCTVAIGMSERMCAKLHTVAATNNRDYPTRSLYCCLFAPHIYGCNSLHSSHLWWLAHAIQRQPRGCNNIPSFLQPHRLHVLLTKAAPGTIFTSWSQHHFVAIRKPELQVLKASHCGSNKATMEITWRDHSIIVCSPIHIWVLFFAHISFVVNRTFTTTSTESLQQYHKTIVLYTFFLIEIFSALHMLFL